MIYWVVNNELFVKKCSRTSRRDLFTAVVALRCLRWLWIGTKSECIVYDWVYRFFSSLPLKPKPESNGFLPTRTYLFLFLPICFFVEMYRWRQYASFCHVRKCWSSSIDSTHTTSASRRYVHSSPNGQNLNKTNGFSQHELIFLLFADIVSFVYLCLCFFLFIIFCIIVCSFVCVLLHSRDLRIMSTSRKSQSYGYI